MKIKIISVGKTKEKYWQMAEADYAKRIQHYAELQQVSVKEASLDTLKNNELVKQTEANKIQEKIRKEEYVVALDKSGIQMDSEKLAEFFQKKILHGNNRINFIIGGPLGLPDDFLNQSDMTLSLSRMTFPHEMTKVILLEQIYRAFSILHGEKYHK
ncbi:MAG: 23S rRNA (pseudouridine(1915)-N(3))-methyltransferase RlmH [bacterium]